MHQLACKMLKLRWRMDGKNGLYAMAFWRKDVFSLMYVASLFWSAIVYLEITRPRLKCKNVGHND